MRDSRELSSIMGTTDIGQTTVTYRRPSNYGELMLYGTPIEWEGVCVQTTACSWCARRYCPDVWMFVRRANTVAGMTADINVNSLDIRPHGTVRCHGYLDMEDISCRQVKATVSFYVLIVTVCFANG